MPPVPSRAPPPAAPGSAPPRPPPLCPSAPAPVEPEVTVRTADPCPAPLSQDVSAILHRRDSGHWQSALNPPQRQRHATGRLERIGLIGGQPGRLARPEPPSQSGPD